MMKKSVFPQRAFNLPARFSPGVDRGFTLVEMLLAVAISSVVALAAYSIFMTSNWSSTTQEELSEAQQSVRVAMERLAQDIRTAGFGLPDPPFSLTIGGTSFSSPVTVTNSSTGSDKIALLGIGYRAGILTRGSATDCNENGNSKICLDDVSAFTNDSNVFQAGRVYVSIGGIEYLQLASSQGEISSQKLSLTGSTLNGTYADADSIPVYIIQAVEYSIATDLDGCSATEPCLASQDFTGLRDSGRQVVAEGVEDIQFAYGVDESPRDGVIDYGATYDADDFLNDPTDDTSIVAVRANVVAKTRHEDRQGNRSFTRPALEDRAEGAADGYRRRALTRIIKLRNPRTGA